MTCRRLLARLLAPALAAALPVAAAAADCSLAILKATQAVDYGRAAAASDNLVEAGNLVTSARIPAIDAAHRAKACGCPDAIPFLAEAALAAERASVATFVTALQQHGDRVVKGGEAALAELRKCEAR